MRPHTHGCVPKCAQVRDCLSRAWAHMTLASRPHVAAQHRTDAQEAHAPFLLRIMPAETGEATRRDALSVSPNFAPSTIDKPPPTGFGKNQNFQKSWQNPQKHPQT